MGVCGHAERNISAPPDGHFEARLISRSEGKKGRAANAKLTKNHSTGPETWAHGRVIVAARALAFGLLLVKPCPTGSHKTGKIRACVRFAFETRASASRVLQAMMLASGKAANRHVGPAQGSRKRQDEYAQNRDERQVCKPPLHTLRTTPSMNG